jgi:hypothetical protein
MSGWILLSGGNEFSDIYAKADLAALEKRVNKTSPLLVVVTAPFPTQELAYKTAQNYFSSLGIETLMSPILSENDLTTENINQIANADAIYFYTSAANVGKIAITSTSTSYVTSSDYRLKENIAPMTGALAKVSALKPVTYTWKADGSDGQGFIAHELQSVVPECVTGEKDAVNEDGSIKAQGIDTSFLVATLTAAIQEQQAIITDLKARIETLEAK